MATISPAEMSTTIKATAEPAPKSYIEKLSRQIWKDSNVVAGPGPPPVIATTLLSFQIWKDSNVVAMTGGGPGPATTLLSFQIWRESFSMYDFGAGSAVAFIVVLISAGLIVAITRALPSDLFASE